jgi:peptide/nickel transport system permease protein
MIRIKVRRYIGSIIGLAILIGFVIAAVLAPLVSPYSPVEMHPANQLEGPNRRFLFGTDEFGRDVLSRVIYGGRVSLTIGFLSVVLCTLFGGIIGVASGYLGGVTDSVLMRIMDVILSFPAIFLAIAIMAFIGPGMINAVIAIAIVYTPRFARVTRAAVLAVRELEFVESARAVGCSHPRILIRHILPQIMAPVTVEATLRLSTALITESTLSFLGLGTQPPNASWGTMISEGRKFMELAPWLSFFPGLAIVLVVLAFNFLGDGLRDALDVRLRNVG